MKGDVFLLRRGDGAGSEVFTKVDALRGTSFTINGEVVDATSKDSDNWRELLTGGGVKSMTISADGVWIAGTTQKTLRAACISGAISNYQIADSDQVIQGAFQVTSFEISGDQGAEQTYSVTLESAGVPAVT